MVTLNAIFVASFDFIDFIDFNLLFEREMRRNISIVSLDFE